jgi:AmmeMemoRadiSam system protein B
MLDIPTLALPLLGHTKVSTLPACQYDLSNLAHLSDLFSHSRKRVFILGPSHHAYLDGCALSKCTEYATPIGALPLDRSSISLSFGISSYLMNFF